MENRLRICISLVATIIFFTGFILSKFYYDDSDNDNKENFTPRINGIVRPHIRNVRRHAENFSDDTNSFFRKMIRKSGLYY